MPTKDIAGQRFGKLVAIRPIGSKSGHTVWLCKCDCGNEHEALSHNLMQGTVKSCGCLVRESNRKKAKHGMHETRLYRVWAAVKIRCYSKNHPTYKNYGARGIGMCDEWHYDFNSFYDWAMANGYDQNAHRYACTLDRIDTNGDYEPSNCRWVTQREQCNNTRHNIFVTINGKRQTVAQWCDELGLNRKTIYTRIYNGWEPEKALTQPIRGKETV